MSRVEHSRVYASTACLSFPERLGKRLERYRRHELIAVELGAGVEIDAGERLDFGDHQVLIHNYFPPPSVPFVLNLASPIPAVREQSLALVRRALHLSADAGAPFYSVHAGFITDPAGFGNGSFLFPKPDGANTAADAMGRFIASIERALFWAKKLKLKLLVENNVCPPHLVETLLLRTPDDFAELFERVPDDALGVLLDTGHLNVSARTLHFSQSDFLSRHRSRIGGVHLHDNDGTADQHLPVQEGSWALEFICSSAHRDIPVIVEASFPAADALAAHIRWLERKLA